MASEDPDLVDRAVELFVYAPVGLGVLVVEATPSFLSHAVERGRQTVTERVTTVRSTGEVAIAFGIPMLRRRLGRKMSTLIARDTPAPPAATAASEPIPEPAPVPPVVANAQWHRAPAADAPDRDELPIPGYDALSASQVVERLAGLEPNELDAVEAYETAHRQRRTILGKIEQLAG